MTDDAVGPRRSRARLLLLITVVLAGDAGVFLVDLWLPPGRHEWLFYVAPVMLCLFSPRAWLPVVAAAVATVLLWFGLELSPQGMLQDSVRENREIGGVLIWVLAGISTIAISSRNQIQFEHWLKQGHARLSELMQSERDRRELARCVLLETSRRLGAQTGALFVSRDHGRYELAGGYAIDPERVTQGPAFQLGEGLIGQTARDNRVRRVRNVPAGYADLRSGLGAAAPRELVLAPLPANGGVEGVIELGFTGPAPALCEAYLQDIGELIGAAFRAVHYQEHLGKLLETSRAQAAELQKRREDLQAINQELEQRSAALQTSQAELEQQRAELEQTNHELARQAVALEHHQQELEGRNAELRCIQDALERKTAQLERASRHKSEFLANMSHELRTPLNSALILARLLADNRHGNLTAEQVKYAETIHHAGTDLLILINDVLDISKIEAGRMEIDPTSFTLAAVAGDVERSFSPLAGAKGLVFAVSAVPGDAKLWADRGRLDQILRNLVANAIKFTARGSVQVELSTEADHALFRVRDTGCGIPAEELEWIFDAFHQAKIDGDRPEGTGLGLSIARRLAILMRGGITLESTPGQGSTFTLRIPLVYDEASRPMRGAFTVVPRTAAAAPRSPPAEPPAPASFTDDRGALDTARRTVLVIEDDEHFAFVLYELIRGLDHQCVVATTGGAGLALAHRHAPDAIILDIKLPDQSGLAVLDQLKSSPRTRHIPVHVLSMVDVTRTAREMGAVSYMLKPPKRDELVGMLSELEARAKQPVKQVLVIDDDAVQRDAIHALIAHDGVEVMLVRTAAEALDRLARSTYDCVVLDLGLPDMSGFELVEKLAAGERFAHPPVIVYTGRALSLEEEQRLQRYARTIVLKGARSPERLLHEVTLFLHKVEEHLPPPHQRLLAEIRKRDRALDEKCILVVDDDVRNVYALTRVLEEQHARVRIARNGREALNELDRDPAVDLVLMDIMMPVMDGHEAIQQIRTRPQFEHLPIIALTAHAMPDDHEHCLRAGADDYLAKPVEVDRLLALLRVWVGNRRGLFS